MFLREIVRLLKVINILGINIAGDVHRIFILNESNKSASVLVE